MMQFPVSSQPWHSLQGVIVKSLRYRRSTFAPSFSAPRSASSKRISVLPPLRGLPKIPKTFIDLSDHFVIPPLPPFLKGGWGDYEIKGWKKALLNPPIGADLLPYVGSIP